MITTQNYRFQSTKEVRQPRDDISKKACLDVPEFYEKLNITEFLDYIIVMED